MSSSSKAPSLNLPQSLGQLWGRGEPCPFDEIIDVRSPGEFADDHIPGAINLPVLDDAERVVVGTVYHRESPFAARKIGASLISANISRFLAGPLADKGKEYRPLIYCWRGGQRSASLATVLAHVGWRVTVLRGGYKTYRNHVRTQLDLIPGLFRYRIVAGPTGSGKTRLLHGLAGNGGQVLDLEGLACHRGSLLGDDGGQPSQKWFDSLLLNAFDRFDPGQPVWVEAESNRIGNLFLPKALWQAMRTAPQVVLDVPEEVRVRQLLGDYPHLCADPDRFKSLLTRLTGRHGKATLENWFQLIDAGDWPGIVAALLKQHYDPAYRHSTGQRSPEWTTPIRVSQPMNDVADAIARKMLIGVSQLAPDSARPPKN
jgi:tRNA 2-selenouridine synthase